jgi:hypothetical protein
MTEYLFHTHSGTTITASFEDDMEAARVAAKHSDTYVKVTERHTDRLVWDVDNGMNTEKFFDKILI